MVIGKLRMKNTDVDAKPLEPQKRRRRHKTRSPSVDPPPDPYGYHEALDQFPSGSSSASRAARDSKGKQREARSGAEDELVIQWTTTSPSVANRLLSVPATNHREFELKLQDALRAENEDLRLESLLQDDLYIPRRWKRHEAQTHAHTDLNGHELGQMELDEYEEYVRKRMWSQSNRKQYLHLKDAEERKKEEREREQQARRKQRLEATQRAERAAQKESRKAAKGQQRCRDTYYQRWEVLNTICGATSKESTAPTGAKSTLDASARQIIRFDEIPWPVYPAGPDVCFPQLSAGIEQLNLNSIQQFLIGHLPVDDLVTKKRIIRSALLSYHPDRFERLISRLQDVDHGPQKAKEWGLRVSQVLNELNHAIE